MRDSLTKWDRGRVLVFGGDIGTSFTVRNTADAAMRAGAGLVVALTKEDVIHRLESSGAGFKLSAIDYSNPPLANTMKLIKNSNALVMGMGLESNTNRLKDFFVPVINNKDVPCIIDADLTYLVKDYGYLLTGETINIMLMNVKETDIYFGEKYPNNNLPSMEAKTKNMWIVLKGSITRIFGPDGSISKIDTSSVPEMLTAGCGDILAGIIGGLVSQGFTLDKAILFGIKIREEAAKRYISISGDITALPKDIIHNIPFIIKGILSKNSLGTN